MTKNIILLSDGTGNAASKVWRTNVWRMFEAIDLSRHDQVAFYADGVGTSSFKPLALFGGMFGWGLKHNVIECYKFACRTYQPGDRIYGFGFSRGAYTIRVVAKFILTQGLVRYTNSEAELERYANAAYRNFRRTHVATVWYIELLRRLRDAVFRTPYEELEKRKVEVPKIHFIGLWDTVSAYGLPVEELTRFYSKWVFPFEVPDTILLPGIERACHALSIDDERTTFHPVLWNESTENNRVGAASLQYTYEERLTQIWFSGVHANVGGGYPDDSLACVPLAWIMKEASQRDLYLKATPAADPDAMLATMSASDKDGRLYDSRKGLASYYRYGPRDVTEHCNQPADDPEDEIKIELPKIHYSVFERIKTGAHPYAPIGLPQNYMVVKSDQSIVHCTAAGYEKRGQAALRMRYQDLAWDGVVKRRLAYFGTVGASAFLILYPLFHVTPAVAEYHSPLRPISDFIRFVGAFIPTQLANYWVDQYARDPIWFLAGIAALVLFLTWGNRLKGQISDGMRSVWRSTLEGTLSPPRAIASPIYRMRMSRPYKAMHRFLQTVILPLGSAIIFFYVVLTLANHFVFNFFDAAGFVCVETSNPDRLTDLLPGQNVVVEFKPSNLCQSTQMRVQENARYVIQFDSTLSFRERGIDASRGYDAADLPDWSQRTMMTLAAPLRREWFRPWFRVVARFGGSGGEENFLDPDFTDSHWINSPVRATRDGELFLFVNDAVIGIPGLFGTFYRNNGGSAQVTITRRD